MKRYKYGDKLLTEDEARALAPDPMFFGRAHAKMKKADALAILKRNIDEIQFWLNQDKAMADGRMAGTITTRSIALHANRLHDWRVSMDILSGGLGRPYMWEE